LIYQKNNKLWVLACNANKLTSLELSSNPELFQLICGDNDLEIMNLTNNNKLYYLSCDNNKLSNINLSGNINLSYLSCNQNQITELDLTKNIYLSELYVSYNNLVNLNLSNLPLQYLYCSNNKITSLDLANSSQLIQVNCSDNQLDRLNLKNGNNDNLKYFIASFNPNLACIQVDNEALSLGYQGWYKDATASYSEDCSTFVPRKTISKALSAGWTWFSVNVTDTDMSTAKVLSNLKSAEGDYIKNQIASATYYNGTGWFGELTQIDPKEMYKIKLSVADTLKFIGFPIDPSIAPISIKSGWNWIGYIPQTARPITEALSTIDPVTDDYIKNQTVSNTFYEGTGWFGYLDNLEPFGGYMLRTSHAGTLTFPAGEPITNGRSGKSSYTDIAEDVYSSIGSVNVTLNTISTSPISIKIMDMQGRVMLTKTFDQVIAGKQNLKVETGSIQRGSYSLIISQDNRITTKQIVIK